jgi:hypothetical protein
MLHRFLLILISNFLILLSVHEQIFERREHLKYSFISKTCLYFRRLHGFDKKHVHILKKFSMVRQSMFLDLKKRSC